MTASNQQSRLIVCSNCERPLRDHCTKHFVPCCPGHCTGTKRGPQSWCDEDDVLAMAIHNYWKEPSDV